MVGDDSFVFFPINVHTLFSPVHFTVVLSIYRTTTMNDISRFTIPSSAADEKLFAFVDSLDEVEPTPPSNAAHVVSHTPAAATAESTVKESKKSEDIWIVISNAFDSWLARIVDVESRLNTDHSFKNDRIDQTIQRMLEDGLIGTCDANELRFVGDAWMRLLNSYSYYSIGCCAYRRDVISALLDLHSARQITKTIFLNVCDQF